MTKSILGLATCFNRKDKTIRAIEALTKGNPSLDFDFIILDDGSKDGTAEALNVYPNVTVLHGDGNCYYSGGMRKAIAAAKSLDRAYDYCLMFNDDVQFYEHCIEYLAGKRNDVVWVGPTCDEAGNLIYSGIVRRSRWIPKYKHLMGETEEGVECDTLNGNCVLIPWHIFLDADNIPGIYRHSFGDYEYGFGITRKGYQIRTSDQYAGLCGNDWKREESWTNPALPRKTRIRMKESVKEIPFKEYFYYLHHNFSLPTAVIYSLAPYIKILLKI